MNDHEKKIALALGAEKVVDLLGIGDATLEDQILLAGKFADIVTKRLLLLVPESRTEDAKRALLEPGATLESFIGTLSELVPDFDQVFDEEVERTVALFRGEFFEKN